MPPLLTTREAADFLRMHVVTLRNKANAGEVPCLRAGGRWRFEENALREWLASGRPSRAEQPSLFETAEAR